MVTALVGAVLGALAGLFVGRWLAYAAVGAWISPAVVAIGISIAKGVTHLKDAERKRSVRSRPNVTEDEPR